MMMKLRRNQPEVWCGGTKNNPTYSINTKTGKVVNPCQLPVSAHNGFWCDQCLNSFVVIWGWGRLRRKDIDDLVNT
mgnify:CR=1 FL=1